MSHQPEFYERKSFWAAIIVGVCGFIGLCMWGGPQYHIYSQRLVPEYRNLCDELAATNVGLSGAEFQRVCELKALELLRLETHKGNGRLVSVGASP